MSFEMGGRRRVVAASVALAACAAGLLVALPVAAAARVELPLPVLLLAVLAAILVLVAIGALSFLFLRRRLAALGETSFDLCLYNAGMDPHRSAGGVSPIDTDTLRINLTQIAAGDIPDIPIVEIRA